MRTKNIFLSFVFGGLVACVANMEDDSLYLTGTEESAITGPNGEKLCENPKKALICHIPPGNPANAHTICVSKNAVDTHASHHGDPIGPCPGDGGGGDGGDGDDGGGDGDGGDDGGGGGDGGGGTDDGGDGGGGGGGATDPVPPGAVDPGDPVGPFEFPDNGFPEATPTSNGSGPVL